MSAVIASWSVESKYLQTLLLGVWKQIFADIAARSLLYNIYRSAWSVVFKCLQSLLLGV